jgi:hypothetical protein
VPWYRIEGKLENPMTEAEFAQGMNQGHFVNQKHKAYCILLYYTGIRRGEGVLLIRDQFRLLPNQLLVDVFFPRPQTKKVKQPDGHFKRVPTGKTVFERFKHSIRTPPIPIPLTAPYADLLEDVVVQTKKGECVFNFCSRTAYNVVRRAFKYPHYFRLSRITWFFMPHPEIDRPQGFSIAEVHSWTGLSLKALDYYLGLVSVGKMGEALAIGGKEK